MAGKVDSDSLPPTPHQNGTPGNEEGSGHDSAAMLSEGAAEVADAGEQDKLPAPDASANATGTKSGSEAESEDEFKSPEEAEAAKQHALDKGKDEYNKGNYEAAIKSWERSAQSITYMRDKNLYADRPEQIKEIDDMELKTAINLAQGFLKTKQYNKAIEWADKALEREHQNAKALYRKASAQVALLCLAEAIQTLESLLEAEPGNAAAKQMCADARRNLRVGEQKEKKMSQKMFASIERDSRVPPTERELWIQWVRNLPNEIRVLWQTVRQQWSDILTDSGLIVRWAEEVKHTCKRFLVDARSLLRSKLSSFNKRD